MKAVNVFFVFMLLLIFSGCNLYKKNYPIGAWQLVYAKQMAGDSVVAQFPGTINGSQIKIWSEKNFFFVGKKKVAPDTVFHDTYGGGTYKLVDNKYQENIEYHFNKLAEHQIFNMILEVKNDTLIQTWPVDQHGDIVRANYYIEKYIRIK
ncbi:hypothetical protein [uncultured Bacteroides sp.]|uniref:hypothetical protein n=1 Tax=uncultured Bacteroides sp. TaxID=162156 RepID=UPI002AAB1777|nr:hypothetical protein [uncultured Bacteroides sp.]